MTASHATFLGLPLELRQSILNIVLEGHVMTLLPDVVEPFWAPPSTMESKIVRLVHINRQTRYEMQPVLQAGLNLRQMRKEAYIERARLAQRRLIDLENKHHSSPYNWSGFRALSLRDQVMDLQGHIDQTHKRQNRVRDLMVKVRCQIQHEAETELCKPWW